MGTVLVTGGAGFLGKYVARSLADAGEQVVITYRRYFQVPQLFSDVMESRVKAVRCDIMDLPELSRVIRDHGVDSIINAVVVNNYDCVAVRAELFEAIFCLLNPCPLNVKWHSNCANHNCAHLSSQPGN